MSSVQKLVNVQFIWMHVTARRALNIWPLRHLFLKKVGASWNIKGIPIIRLTLQPDLDVVILVVYFFFHPLLFLDFSLLVSLNAYKFFFLFLRLQMYLLVFSNVAVFVNHRIYSCLNANTLNYFSFILFFTGSQCILDRFFLLFSASL